MLPAFVFPALTGIEWFYMHCICIITTMDIAFDPANARSTFRKHGVGFAHAEDALRDGMALTC